MRLASTGKISTINLLTAIDLLGKDFSPANLPVCVDFDHVFDIKNPSRCFARSNIENPTENLFYIIKPSQSILNQAESGLISLGKYFSLLPCKSVDLEDSVNYTNNLVLAAYIVSDEDATAELVSVVKNVYDQMGVSFSTSICEDTPHCVCFIVNGVVVCKVETFSIDGYYISVANIISEPVFSIACSLTN